MTISNEFRGAIKKIFEPIALAMGRIGLTPNGLTLIGFAITAVGAVLSGAQVWVIGGIVVFVGGVFDMFDGTLARATGKASKFGAFMDSTFDSSARSSSSSASSLGAVVAGVGTVPHPGRRRHGRIDHGQLHPREVRRPRLPPAWAWPRSASCPARSASSIISLGIVLHAGDEHRRISALVVRPRRSSSSVRSSPSSSGSSMSAARPSRPPPPRPTKRTEST